MKILRKTDLVVGLAIFSALGLIMGTAIAVNLMDKADNNSRQKKPSAEQPLLRTCPQYWYRDEMPSVGRRSEQSREYFIIKGKRVEKKDVDVNWVIANCPVNKPTIIQ